MVNPNYLGNIIRRMGGWLKTPLHASIFLIAIAMVLLASYLIWARFIKEPIQDFSITSNGTAAEDEKVSAEFTNNKLTNQDYELYQNVQRSLALKYLDANDVNDALRVLNEIINRVPVDKISSSTYSAMAEIQEKAKNTPEQKKYLELYINKLKAEEGNNSYIAEIIKTTEKELDSLP